MKGITKQIAATLYGNNYELVDKDGVKWQVSKAMGKCVSAFNAGTSKTKIIFFDRIGTDYFILARRMSDLTKNIEGIGVPIDKLKEISTQHHWNNSVGYLLKNAHSVRGMFPEYIAQWLDKNHFLRGVDESLIKYIE